LTPNFIITHSTFYENQHLNSPSITNQKLFCSYILVGDFTIITPTFFAHESLKPIVMAKGIMTFEQLPKAVSELTTQVMELRDMVAALKPANPRISLPHV
jgi:hypothetical protein